MAMTFATEARKQIAAEKRAAKELHLVARAAFKATSATLYAIRSEDKIYHTTTVAGRVTSCIDSATGDTCKGRAYTGKCKHGDFAMQFENEHGALEAKRQNEMDGAATVAPMVLGSFSQGLPEHLDDTFSAQADAIVAAEKSQQGKGWDTFIGPDGSVLYHEHASDCDCRACEDARWKKIERECVLSSNRAFSFLR